MGTTRNKRKRTATSSRKRNIQDVAFHVRCAVESEENRFSEYVKTSKVPQGWWKTEPYTKSGRLRLKVKVMMLMSIPVAVLLGIAFYFTIDNIKQNTQNNSGVGEYWLNGRSNTPAAEVESQPSDVGFWKNDWSRCTTEEST
ncbi:hypothetical protein LSAT2_004767, partial [Lamellibrachia satsuma]